MATHALCYFLFCAIFYCCFAPAFTVAVVVFCNTVHRSVQYWEPVRFDCQTSGVEKQLNSNDKTAVA